MNWFSMEARQSRDINILFENLLTGRMKRDNGRGRGEKEEYIRVLVGQKVVGRREQAREITSGGLQGFGSKGKKHLRSEVNEAP